MHGLRRVRKGTERTISARSALALQLVDLVLKVVDLRLQVADLAGLLSGVVLERRDLARQLLDLGVQLRYLGLELLDGRLVRVRGLLGAMGLATRLTRRPVRLRSLAAGGRGRSG